MGVEETLPCIKIENKENNIKIFVFTNENIYKKYTNLGNYK